MDGWTHMAFDHKVEVEYSLTASALLQLRAKDHPSVFIISGSHELNRQL